MNTVQALAALILATLLAGTATAHNGHDTGALSGILAGLLHPWLANWQHPLVSLLAGFAGGVAARRSPGCRWPIAIVAVYALLHTAVAGNTGLTYAAGIMIGSAPLFIAAYAAGHATAGRTSRSP